MQLLRFSKVIAPSLGLVLLATFSFGQAVSINGTGTAPDAQAILDLSTTTKGVLFPRLTTVQRDAIGQGNNTDYGHWTR